jgi:hypothetical protein
MSLQTSVPVTADNFVRAETDLYFSNVVKDDGFGKFMHIRTPTPLDHQNVIRMNRDTLYSGAVFDLDAGAVTIIMPDAGKRFMSMQLINEDEYTPMVVYGAGTYELTKDKIGTRYVLAVARTLVDPNKPGDLDEVHRLQDAIALKQKSAGKFEIANWDKASQDKTRSALLSLAADLSDTTNMFGTKEQVDAVRHLIGAASAWGGNPSKEAMYLNVIPANNDGTGVYKLTVKDVPVDGFWSISLYNGAGYFEKNAQDVYSVNNLTAIRDADGSVTVQFGGCDGKAPNCLPIMKGWNYLVRLYQPRAEAQNGTWKFPEAQRVV